MGRKRAVEQSPQRFMFEPDSHGGITILRDGHPQSHVILNDPRLIEFEYVQLFALVLDSLQPQTPAPLAITHIGGAGLSLPRYVEATRPGSPQIVLEPDTELTEAVRRELPLPRQHRIRVRGIDGATGIKALHADSADVLVLDAFAEGQVPPSLVTPDFIADAARILTSRGILLANLSDEPGLAWVMRVLATLQPELPNVAMLAPQEILKGRRFGNVVVVASASPLEVDELRRRAARAMFPTGVRAGAILENQRRSAAPFTTETAEPSPVPPALGAWRVR